MEMAERYLRLLAGGDVPHTFQPYHDQDPNSPATAWMRRRVQGRLGDVWPRLVARQAKGAAIAVTIAETDGRGRTSANMVRPRANWIEADGALPRPPPLPPTITVETSPGRRHYIYVCRDLDWQVWDGVQQLLIGEYGSDPRAGMRTQVLRIPGTLHLKNRTQPHLVRIVEEMTTERIYTVSEIVAAFPPKSPPPRRQHARKAVEKAADCYPPDILAALRAIDARLQASGPFIAQGDDPDDQPFEVDWSRRDFWLRATACLHHASAGSEAGFALSCAASGGDSALGLVGCPAKFNRADQRRLWDSLSTDEASELPDGYVTIRTIYWIARRYCDWKTGRRGRPHGQPRPPHEFSAKALAVAEAGRRALDIGLDKVRAAHAALAAQRVRRYSLQDNILSEIRQRLNPHKGYWGISSLTGLANTLGCSPETLRRYLRQLVKWGLIIKNDGNATSALGTSGITVGLNLPDGLLEALRRPLLASRGDPPLAEPTGSRIQYLSNGPGCDPSRSPTSDEASCCSAGSGTLRRPAETAGNSRANPSHTRTPHAFDAAGADRANDFLASVLDIELDWLPAAQAANDYRADFLWRIAPGRRPADLITLWLSSGLLPEDACQKIGERIARALKANSERRISLDNLVRDIDALTDALTKLFEEARGDLDAVYVAISEAIRDSADRHAYRLRRSKGEKAGEVDLPDVAMLPPSQFVSDLIVKLHRQIDKITQQPCGTSLNEATARLGRIAFTKPVATRSQQL
jgi:RepB DNA-primase from phage plasmid